MNELEAAERREVIRKLREYISKRVEESLKSRAAVEKDARSKFSGNIYDDEAEERRIRELDIAAGRLYATELAFRDMWEEVVKIFGKSAVSLAIEEGEHRIGELPYTDVT